MKAPEIAVNIGFRRIQSIMEMASLELRYALSMSYALYRTLRENAVKSSPIPNDGDGANVAVWEEHD